MQVPVSLPGDTPGAVEECPWLPPVCRSQSSQELDSCLQTAYLLCFFFF